MPTTPDPVLSVRLPPEEKSAVERVAVARGQTVSQFVRQTLSAMVRIHDQQHKEPSV